MHHAIVFKSKAGRELAKLKRDIERSCCSLSNDRWQRTVEEVIAFSDKIRPTVLKELSNKEFVKQYGAFSKARDGFIRSQSEKLVSEPVD